MSSKNIYYVYEHIDPATDETVYVGCGQGQRGWMMGNRSRLLVHFLWFKRLERQGITLDQIVRIRFKELNKREALRLEATLVEEKKPRFNVHGVTAPTYTRGGKERLRAALKGNKRVCGYKWITDGIVSKRLKPGLETPTGFTEGRATPWQ